MGGKIKRRLKFTKVVGYVTKRKKKKKRKAQLSKKISINNIGR